MGGGEGVCLQGGSVYEMKIGWAHFLLAWLVQGHAKAQRLVAILKSHQFMERYQAEISARDERIKESKKLGYTLPCLCLDL